MARWRVFELRGLGECNIQNLLRPPVRLLAPEWKCWFSDVGSNTLKILNISGTVFNSTGIPGVLVTTNTSNSTITDASGFYSLLVPAGTYNLTATREPVFYANSSVILTAIWYTVAQDIELTKKTTGTIGGTMTSVWTLGFWGDWTCACPMRPNLGGNFKTFFCCVYIQSVSHTF